MVEQNLEDIIEVAVEAGRDDWRKVLVVRDGEREIAAFEIEAWLEPYVGVYVTYDGVSIEITEISGGCMSSDVIDKKPTLVGTYPTDNPNIEVRIHRGDTSVDKGVYLLTIHEKADFQTLRREIACFKIEAEAEYFTPSNQTEKLFLDMKIEKK